MKRVAAAAAAMIASNSADAALSYYIGVDDLQTIASGVYAGLPNPNYGRLTFLYAHTYTDTPTSNHYHSKGILTYTGANLGAGTAVIRSASDFTPEGTNPPIQLSAGSGLYGGKLVSNGYEASHFSFLEMGATDQLAGFAAGTGEAILFNSSSGRWDSTIAASHLHVEIVSLTPGLNLGSSTTLSLGGAGTELHLADAGDAGGFSFTPVLWTDADAAPGNYEAVLRFFDEDGTYGDSGNIRIITQVIPEPSSALLLAGGLGGLALRRRRAGRLS